MSTWTCRGKAPPSCYARPFCRLKAPLGLSLLRYASQTRTFENMPLSAACKKKKGELWQKERGLDGASPLDKFFKSETGYRTMLSNRFCKRSNISSSTVKKVRSDRKFKRWFGTSFNSVCWTSDASVNTGRPHSIILLLSYGSPHQYVFGCIAGNSLLAPAFSAVLP